MTNIFVKSFGCSASFSDGEIIQGLLNNADFDISDEALADIIIINICTVKGDHAALREIKKTHELYPKKKIIIAGCITDEIIPKIREFLPDVSFISTHNIKEIVQIVEETLNDNPVSILAKGKVEKILLPRIKKNPVIGIVQIAIGCVNKCSYCSTKLIKGNLCSFTVERIVEDVKQLVKDGCKEIWLTAQDNSCYGFDINTNLANLLKEVCNIEGEFLVRIGMGNPKHFKTFTKELIQAFKHPKMFKFLHIPVQSGNNEILKAMNRGYKVEEFVDMIDAFRKEIPDITISTDIIVGFPGESDEQFQDSLNLIKKIKPEVLNISRFVPRERTKAFDMENKVSSNAKKDRSKQLTSLHEWLALELNRKWKKWEGEVLVDEFGSENSMITRNSSYKPIVIKQNLNLRLGDKTKVKITGISANYLIGEVPKII